MSNLEEMSKKFDPSITSQDFDWNEFAIKLQNEFGESLIDENTDENDPHNWWLRDVTVTEIVEFVKNYK